MAVNSNAPRKGYSISVPLSTITPPPIVSQRAPTATDRSSIGQEWIVESTNSVYILTSIVAGVAAWQLITSPFSSVWYTVTTTPTLLAVDAGYGINYAGVAVLNLPNVATAGFFIDVIQVDATAGRGFQINKNGNTLYNGSASATTITYTNIAAPYSDARGSIQLVSTGVNTWSVFGALGGSSFVTA